jgi:hypothetical protein
MSSLVRIVAPPGYYHCCPRSLSLFVVTSVVLGQQMCSLVWIVARRQGAVVVFPDRSAARVPLLLSPLSSGVRHICCCLLLHLLYLANSECSLIQIVPFRQGDIIVFPDCCAAGAPLSSSQIVVCCPHSHPVCAIFIIIRFRLSSINMPLQQHMLTLSRLPLLPLLPLLSLVEDDGPSAPPPGGEGHATGGKYFHFRRQTSGGPRCVGANEGLIR